MSLQNYRIHERIYENHSARVVVSKGMNWNGTQAVVIKEQTHESLKLANNAIAEALNQTRLSHPGICAVYECFIHEEPGHEFKSVIVEEMMEGDLLQEINRRHAESQPWTEYVLMSYLKDLSEACAFAQQHCTAHRDIKPQNIFVAQGKLKLGDFGSSSMKMGAEACQTVQGSPFFLSPELKIQFAHILVNDQQSFTYDAYQSDVYSLGITFLYMALLDAPSAMMNLTTLEEMTMRTLSQIQYMPRLLYALQNMLVINPLQRATFAQVCQYAAGQLYEMSSQGYPPQEQPELVQVAEVIQNPGVGSWTQNEYPMTSSLSQSSQMPVSEPVYQQFRSCCMCGEAVRDNTWEISVPEKLRQCSAFYTDLCSLACLRKMNSDVRTGSDLCMLDSEKIGTKEGKPELFRCGHGFCNKGCLCKYLRRHIISSSSNISLKCSVCGSKIEEEEVKQHFENKGDLMRSIFNSAEQPICPGCEASAAELSLPCGHKICIVCSSKKQNPTNRRCICPVCGKSEDLVKSISLRKSAC